MSDDARRVAARERQRLARQRRRDGCIVVRVVVCEATFSTLERLGLLRPFEDDPGVVGNSVEDALEILSRVTSAPPKR